MRILLVTYLSFPMVSGVNTYINLLKHELEEHGHQVDIMAHTPDNKKVYMANTGQEFKKHKIKRIIHKELVLYFRKHLQQIEPSVFLHEVDKYAFEFAAASFDLSQYELIHTQDVISARALRRVTPAHIPVVTTIHGSFSNIFRHYGWIKDEQYLHNIEHYGVMSSSEAIVPTKWLKQELICHFNVAPAKISLIPYGVDLLEFQKAVNRMPEPAVQKDSNQFVISCVARLSPEKGHKTLLQAICILKQQGYDFMCWLIGNGPLHDELKAYCRDQEILENVVFLGPRSDVPSLLKQTDILILPSIEDNQPFSIIEAQLAGKAIIASNAGGIPEMIDDGITGLIFEKNDNEELAEKIIYLMTDRKRLHQLGANAKAWGESQWSSNSLYRHTTNLYQRVITADVSPDHEVEKSPRTIFSFDTDSKLRDGEWKAILDSLPYDYSIPDKIVMSR